MSLLFCRVSWKKILIHSIRCTRDSFIQSDLFNQLSVEEFELLLCTANGVRGFEHNVQNSIKNNAKRSIYIRFTWFNQCRKRVCMRVGCCWSIIIKSVYIHLLIQHSSVVCSSRIPPMFLLLLCCCRCLCHYIRTNCILYHFYTNCILYHYTIVRTRTEIAMETDANFIVVTHQFYHLQVFQR